MQPVFIFDLLLLTPRSRFAHSICCCSHHAAGLHIRSAATHNMQPIFIFDLVLLTLCSRFSYSICCYSCKAAIKIFDLLLHRRNSILVKYHSLSFYTSRSSVPFFQILQFFFIFQQQTYFWVQAKFRQGNFQNFCR